MRQTDNNVTIIVNSCDNYEDVWEPFFKMFSIHWPNCPYDIILNTETKKFRCDYLNVKTVNAQTDLFDEKGVDWSTRLLNVLKYVESSFVIMMLDDEFLTAEVDKKGLNKAIKRMKRDARISMISFAVLGGYGTSQSKLYKDLKAIHRTKKTQHSANAAIWKKDRLVKYLKSGESIWEFESLSRTRRGLFDKCYYFRDGKSPLQTVPAVGVNGYGITQGKWMWKTEDFLKEYGIEIDVSKRGVFTQENAQIIINEHLRKKEERKKGGFLKRISMKAHLIKTSLPPEVRIFLGKIKHFGKSN